MTDLLEVDPGDAVLEIGTGCGYHAAVTAELVGDENVYTVEYSGKLAERAREQLADLGYDGVSIRVGDGRDGWPKHAPYDAVYFTCAATDVPDPVVDQVRPGGQAARADRDRSPDARRRDETPRQLARTDQEWRRSIRPGCEGS